MILKSINNNNNSVSNVSVSMIVNFREPSFEDLVCKYLPGTRGTHFSCHEVLIFLPGSLDTGIHRTNQIGALGHVTRCRAGCDCDWSSRATPGAGGMIMKGAFGVDQLSLLWCKAVVQVVEMKWRSREWVTIFTTHNVWNFQILKINLSYSLLFIVQ